MIVLIKRVMNLEEYFTQNVIVIAIFILLGLSGIIYYYRMQLKLKQRKDRNLFNDLENQEEEQLIVAGE